MHLARSWDWCLSRLGKFPATEQSCEVLRQSGGFPRHIYIYAYIFMRYMYVYIYTYAICIYIYTYIHFPDKQVRPQILVKNHGIHSSACVLGIKMHGHLGFILIGGRLARPTFITIFSTELSGQSCRGHLCPKISAISNQSAGEPRFLSEIMEFVEKVGQANFFRHLELVKKIG